LEREVLLDVSVMELRLLSPERGVRVVGRDLVASRRGQSYARAAGCDGRGRRRRRRWPGCEELRRRPVTPATVCSRLASDERDASAKPSERLSARCFVMCEPSLVCTGGRAISRARDLWLCVPDSRRVCHFQLIVLVCTGGRAISRARDLWLCVPDSRRVCHFQLGPCSARRR